MLPLQVCGQHGPAPARKMQRRPRDAGQAEADTDMADQPGEIAGGGIEPRGLGGEAQQIARRGVGMGLEFRKIGGNGLIELALPGLNHALERGWAEQPPRLQGREAFQHGVAARAGPRLSPQSPRATIAGGSGPAWSRETESRTRASSRLKA